MVGKVIMKYYSLRLLALLIATTSMFLSAVSCSRAGNDAPRLEVVLNLSELNKNDGLSLVELRWLSHDTDPSRGIETSVGGDPTKPGLHSIQMASTDHVKATYSVPDKSHGVVYIQNLAPVTVTTKAPANGAEIRMNSKVIQIPISLSPGKWTLEVSVKPSK